jgi:uncharacterized membrane protein
MQPTAVPTGQRDAQRATRLTGIDVARCVAILGMFAAHIGPDPTDGGAASALEVFHGRSAALFALLAGISLALLSGRQTALRDRPYRQAIARIGARAVLVFVLGLWLVSLGTLLEVILPYYALYFLIALPLLRLPARRLALTAAVWAVAGPVLSFAVRSALGWNGPLTGLDDGEVPWLEPGRLLVDLFFTGAYPAATFMPFVLAGMALGRLDLRALSIRRWMIAGGAALAVVGYGGSWLLVHLGGMQGPLTQAAAALHHRSSDPLQRVLTDEAGTVPYNDVRWLAVAAPHSGTPFEVAGALGVALLVLGAAMLIASRWPRAIAPLAATGSLALTVYVGQVVAVAAGLAEVTDQEWVNLLLFAVVAVLFCWWWKRFLGRGPLERALHALSTGISSRVR